MENTTHIINIHPEHEVKRRHVCYYVLESHSERGTELRLMEVSEVFYQLPNSPILTPRLEDHEVLRTKPHSLQHPEVFLMLNHQRATRNSMILMQDTSKVEEPKEVNVSDLTNKELDKLLSENYPSNQTTFRDKPSEFDRLKGITEQLENNCIHKGIDENRYVEK